MQSRPQQIAPRAETVIPPELLALARRITLRLGRGVSADFVGAFRSQFRGTGLSFSELRPYQPGDDPRRIHWRASARSGTTFVKQYDEERSLRFFLLLDTSASLGAALPNTAKQPLQQVTELAALVALIARRGGDQFGFAAGGSALQASTALTARRRTIEAAVRTLLSLTPSGPTDLPALISSSGILRMRRSVVLLISDFLAGPGCNNTAPADYSTHATLLQQLSARHEVVVVHVPPAASAANSPNAKTPLPNVLLEVRDSESGDSLTVDTRYFPTAAITNHRDQIAQLTLRAGARFTELESSPIATLSRIMQRGKSPQVGGAAA